MPDQRLRYVIEFDSKNATASIDKVKDSEEKMGKAGEDAGSRASHGINKMTESMTASVAKGALLMGVIVKITEAAKNYFQQAMMDAAQDEKHEVILRKLAETHRMSAGAVMDRVKAVEKLGYLDEDAMSLVGKMIYAQMDLSKATQVATAAKNAGAFADIKSTDALEAMLFAAETGFSKPLRNMNIFVDLAKKITEEQKRLGYEMTESERRTYSLNLIMAEAAKLNGTWEAKMGTSAGKMESLGLAAQKLKEAIGKEFQGDLDNIVNSMKNMAEWAGKNKDTLASVIKYTVEFAGVLVATQVAVKIWEVVVALRAMSLAATLNPVGLVVAGLATAGFVAYNFQQESEKRWAEEAETRKGDAIRAALGKGKNVAQLKKDGYSEEDITRAVTRNRTDDKPLDWGKSGIRVKGFERPGDEVEPHKMLKNAALEEAEKKAHDILMEAIKGEFEGLAKIIMEYKVYQAEVGKTAKARADLAKAFGITIHKEVEKEQLKTAREHLKALDEDQKRASEELAKKTKERFEYQGETAAMDLENIDHMNDVWKEQAQNQRDAKLRGLQMVHADTMAAQIKLEGDKAAVEIYYIETEAQLHKASIARRLDREVEYLYSLGHIHPEMMVEIEERLRTIREKSQNETDDVDRKKRAEVDAQRDQATIRSADLIRSHMQSQFDSLKKSAGDVFDALLTKSSNIFTAIGNIFKTAILTAIKDIVTSRVAGTLMQMLYGQKVTFANNGGAVGNTPVFGGGGGGGGTSGIGGIFRGLFGGGSQQQQQQGGPATVGGGGASMGFPRMLGEDGTAQLFASNRIPDMPGPFASPFSGGAFSNTVSDSGRGPFSPAAAMQAALKPGSGGGTNGILSKDFLKNLKGTNWGGFTHSPSRWSMDEAGNMTKLSDGKITGVNGAAGAGLQMGGMALAQQGLMGSSRGTWTGVGEGAAGGAMIGLQMGGPLGALIGGIAGFGIGLGEKLAGVETPRNEAIRLVKQIYSLKINNGTADQIVAIAKSTYGNNVGVAVRSAEVRKMLQLYAESTGQKSNLFLNDPRGVSLMQSGGRLNQSAVYNNGTGYTYQSVLPTLGNSAGTIPTGNPFAGGVTVMVSPEATQNLWATGVAQGIAGSPRQVAAANVRGGAASSARLSGANLMFDSDMVAF
jgi:hypothetical protein